MNELDCLAQLSELVEKIEKNNWKHLYQKVDVPITAGIIRKQQENDKLQKALNEAKSEINKLKSLARVCAKHLAKEAGLAMTDFV